MENLDKNTECNKLEAAKTVSNKPDRKKIDWAHVGRLGLSSLNGVVGDYLVEENNPLATKIGFCAQRRYIDLNAQSLADYPYQLSNRLVIMLHGLTNLETIWNMSEEGDAHDDNYASRLYQKFGYTPFYLRYNTGLKIETNGAAFSQLMQSLIETYPQPVDEIVLIGFSMGGLVIRHALHDAHKDGADWIDRVSKCVYIGSPHDGAPLEKFGHMASGVLRKIPKPYFSHWAEWIDVRSTGIQDLKHGLVDEAYDGEHGYLHPEQGSVASRYGFLPTIQHHFISGSVGKSHQSMVNYLVGDSMVRMPSALPVGAPEGSPAAHFYGTPHLKLAYSEKVYQQLEHWLAIDDVAARRSAERTLPAQIARKSDLHAAQVSGAVSLLGTGISQLANTVEHMHKSISDEPFDILEKIPVTAPVSKPIREVHNAITSSIYSGIKLGGKLLHDAGKTVDDMLMGEPPK